MSVLYFLLLTGAAFALILLFPLRWWGMRWGATADEVTRALPGDDIVPDSRLTSTRAISVSAAPGDIWPWLAQMGQGRGGLYSYTTLENLIGCDLHNADDILPEFQDLRVGERIRFGPEGYPYQVVTQVVPGRTLVMRAADPKSGEPADATWVFHLEEEGPGRTRLITRSRNDYGPGLVPVLIWKGIVAPIHFIMEQKMLRGIKQRAEARARQPVAGGV